MLLGFKRRFAPFVEEGSKTHTIPGAAEDPSEGGRDVSLLCGPAAEDHAPAGTLAVREGRRDPN